VLIVENMRNSNNMIKNNKKGIESLKEKSFLILKDSNPLLIPLTK